MGCGHMYRSSRRDLQSATCQEPNVASARQAHPPNRCEVQSYSPVMTGTGCAEPVTPLHRTGVSVCSTRYAAICLFVLLGELRNGGERPRQLRIHEIGRRKRHSRLGPHHRFQHAHRHPRDDGRLRRVFRMHRRRVQGRPTGIALGGLVVVLIAVSEVGRAFYAGGCGGADEQTTTGSETKRTPISSAGATQCVRMTRMLI